MEGKDLQKKTQLIFKNVRSVLTSGMSCHLFVGGVPICYCTKYLQNRGNLEEILCLIFIVVMQISSGQNRGILEGFEICLKFHYLSYYFLTYFSISHFSSKLYFSLFLLLFTPNLPSYCPYFPSPLISTNLPSYFSYLP
jgi:hypothetical protein